MSNNKKLLALKCPLNLVVSQGWFENGGVLRATLQVKRGVQGGVYIEFRSKGGGGVLRATLQVKRGVQGVFI